MQRDVAVTRATRAVLWVATVVVALGLGGAGALKFGNAARWEHLMTGWGYPAWFRSVVGVVEIAGAVALLVPRLARYAVVPLIAVMVGALVTLRLHPGSGLGSGGTPALYLGLLGVIAAVRWRRT